mmetsp:Transcript_29453/g.45343  ORF Transcript_29453/g.45343 Transcript_29453/m.45343 type:complete len:94 (-) Transcript_29453:1310-1591(-)
MQMMFEYPLCEPPLLPPSPPGFGETSPLRGKPATSEKKKDVLTVGVLGVRGPPRGVFIIDPKPPGENRPFAVGDCNHARTLEESKGPEFGGLP